MLRYFHYGIGMSLLCLLAVTASAQQRDSVRLSHALAIRNVRDTGYKPPHYRLNQQLGYAQWDILMNPIYLTQASGKYKLNGQPKGYAPTPKFYSLQPGQNALLGNTITDEAGGYYGSFRICAFDHSRWGFLHNMRLVGGVTHDKLQTVSDGDVVHYKYNDGGTEAAVMLEKNLLPDVTESNYRSYRLIFDWNAQAGLFASLAKIQTHILYGSDTIASANDNRFQFPNPRSGWGGIVASNIEVGVPVCYRFFINRAFTDTRVGRICFWWFRRGALTIGARLMAEYLHSGVDVTLNGQSGYHLTHNNFALSFSGPILAFHLINNL